jgi:phosphatidylserine decarboxylase
VDGTILHFGEIHDKETIEQVKGTTYSLQAFLGPKEDKDISLEIGVKEHSHTKNKVYHCVIYLAPGDYHGIHTPVDFHVKKTRHFPGLLFINFNHKFVL